MSIHSINIFTQRPSKTPLQTIQSTGWIALTTLTLPIFIKSRKPFDFFKEKEVKVWGQDINFSKICETILEEWVAEAPTGEKRALARKKIQDFLKCPCETDLKLKSLQITSLPDIFNDLRFNRLKKLDLGHNKLKALPESLSNLQALAYLLLNNNELTTLPESLGNLQALIELNLIYNQLTALPESFDNLQALTKLDLTRNKLRTLPESLGSLQALTELNLTRNELRNLPKSLGSLQALTKLDLTRNELITLPESLGSLQTLTELNLTRNELMTLPESLGNLQALTELNLLDNPTLRELPMGILRLSSGCNITLMGCSNLSMNTRERLRVHISSPGYSGPHIPLFIYDNRDLAQEKAIEKSLSRLYTIIGKSSRKFAKLEKTSKLHTWLLRLAYTADYQLGKELQKAFAAKILDYLNQADEDEGFRTIFYETIEDAVETCGDRITLSILHLSIAYQLAKIDLKDMKGLANFLIKGPWAIEMLQNKAYDKVKRLTCEKGEIFGEEIEVYLAYPIKLKEKLGIPIDVRDMHFFRCSYLKDEDLQEAQEFVLSKQKNQEECFKFLAKHSTWEKSLSSNYPEKYQAILNKRAEAAEQEDPDYDSIEKEWKKDLIALTEKVLQK